MALRFKVIDLSGFPTGQPIAVTIDCAYWMLRASGVVRIDTMDSVPLIAFGGLNGPGDIEVRLDFPPVFDGNGKMVPWNQVVYFNLTAPPTNGASVILVYDDPGLAPTPH